MLELMHDPETWIALATLTALEIVLGIDNIVFIAILSDRVQPARRALAYRLGLGGAMLTRIGLLLTISWVMGLTRPLFTVLGREVSGRGIILLLGGAFLIAKSAHEIYDKVEHEAEEAPAAGAGGAAMVAVVLQIMVMDIVFSLDSVITAVGMVDHVPVMVTAIVLAVIVMMLFAPMVGGFVNRNPSMKILALAFLLLIGVLLTAEGLGQHVDKGTIYFAMAFALVVELLNLRFRRRHPRRVPRA
ncbi:MAG: TerC family protein [Pseudomonadota bacterium]